MSDRERPAGDADDGNLIVDRLSETYRLITGDPSQAVERALDEVGINTRAEAEMMAELAFTQPLAHPDHFEQAHRITMRALEVADRQGWKNPKVPRLGPFSGVAQSAIEFVSRTIVRAYVARVIRNLAMLYARREAQAPVMSQERRSLARARIQAERLAVGFKGGGLPIPTVLVGGAALPVLASVARSAGVVKKEGSPVVIALGIVLVAVFGVMSWVLLQGAGLSHRRIAVGVTPALRALYETIGHCGHPPRDESRSLAVVAIALTFIGWFIVPLVIAAVVTLL